MEVILLEKVANLGNLGDRVHVKPGYGRNYLVPQGMAVYATGDNLVQFEARRAELEQKAAAALAAAQERATKLVDMTVTLAAKASEEGKLFGSVGTAEIAHAVTATGIDVSKQEVRLPHGVIRQLGEFSIQLQLHTDVIVTVPLVVVAEK